MPHITGPGMYNSEGYTLELAEKSVGKGWAGLLCEVFEEVQKYPHLKISQVKEKWGLLRIYVDAQVDLEDSLFENDESVKDFWYFLTEIEKRSSKICEDCGSPGLSRKSTWIRTLCDNCHKNQE